MSTMLGIRQSLSLSVSPDHFLAVILLRFGPQGISPFKYLQSEATLDKQTVVSEVAALVEANVCANGRAVAEKCTCATPFCEPKC